MNGHIPLVSSSVWREEREVREFRENALFLSETRVDVLGKDLLFENFKKARNRIEYAMTRYTPDYAGPDPSQKGWSSSWNAGNLQNLNSTKSWVEEKSQPHSWCSFNPDKNFLDKAAFFNQEYREKIHEASEEHWARALKDIDFSAAGLAGDVVRREVREMIDVVFKELAADTVVESSAIIRPGSSSSWKLLGQMNPSGKTVGELEPLETALKNIAEFLLEPLASTVETALETEKREQTSVNGHVYPRKTSNIEWIEALGENARQFVKLIEAVTQEEEGCVVPVVPAGGPVPEQAEKNLKKLDKLIQVREEFLEILSNIFEFATSPDVRNELGLDSGLGQEGAEQKRLWIRIPPFLKQAGAQSENTIPGRKKLLAQSKNDVESHYLNSASGSPLALVKQLQVRLRQRETAIIDAIVAAMPLLPSRALETISEETDLAEDLDSAAAKMKARAGVEKLLRVHPLWRAAAVDDATRTQTSYALHNENMNYRYSLYANEWLALCKELSKPIYRNEVQNYYFYFENFLMIAFLRNDGDRKGHGLTHNLASPNNPYPKNRFLGEESTAFYKVSLYNQNGGNGMWEGGFPDQTAMYGHYLIASPYMHTKLGNDLFEKGETWWSKKLKSDVTGNKARAQAHYRRAIQIDPVMGSAGAYYGLAAVELQDKVQFSRIDLRMYYWLEHDRSGTI